MSSAPLISFCQYLKQILRIAGQQDPQDNLPEGREREPEEEDKLEDVVEGEPVDDLNEALNHSEKREDDPVLQN